MPNPKLETYKNKATGDVYDYTDADAQGKLTAILDGEDIDSFGDVETALDGKVDKVAGKGLSTYDYDDTEKAKVAGAFPRSEQAVLGAVNILNNIGESKSQNNVTFTVNADKSVTVVTGDGGASADTTLILAQNIPIPSGINWYLKGCPSGGASSKYFLCLDLFASPYTNYAQDIGAGALIHDYVESNSVCYIRIKSGAVISTPITFKPQICLSLDTPYAPFAMTNRELMKTSPKITIETLKLEVSGSVVHSVLIWGCGGATTPVLALICISNATQGTAQAFKLTNVDYYDVTATREGNIVTINVLHNGTEQLWSGISWIATSRGTIREVK